MNNEQFDELLLQALEHEIGGIRVYETAIECALNDELKEEWEKYLEETREHEQKLRDLIDEVGLDTNAETPGREIVRSVGEALVKTMRMAKKVGTPESAQIVACECVVLAETKDHLNWELIGLAATRMRSAEAKQIKEVQRTIEEQEDEHLYHSKGWCRELWIESLGMPAVLPPPEEERHVKTAIGAARAAQAREKML